MDRALADTVQSAREYLDPKDVDCVVYHAPCNDGSGAAVAAWMLLEDKATYVPRTYHKEFPEESVRGKNVVILDASFNKDQFLHLRSIAKKIMIVDHHDSAMQELSDTTGCFFTMQNSGAILSWHYFHGIDVPAPPLLRLIEDRDLWCWRERELSEPLYYALKERVPHSEFKSFLPYLASEKLNELIEYGTTLVAANQKWCADAAVDAKRRTFTVPGDTKTYNIMCREVVNDRLTSELSEYLYNHNEVDFIMLWACTSSGQYKVSFRSNHPEINVGAIATQLGGGGHKQAAGVVLNYSPWELTA